MTPTPWLRPPIAPWRIRCSDAAVYLAILTTAGGASSWSLRWIPAVMDWGEVPRALTAPGHTLALLLSGYGPADHAVILPNWPFAAPCILINALLLWAPGLLLRSPRVPAAPVALWLLAAMAVSVALYGRWGA